VVRKKYVVEGSAGFLTGRLRRGVRTGFEVVDVVVAGVERFRFVILPILPRLFRQPKPLPLRHALLHEIRHAPSGAANGVEPRPGRFFVEVRRSRRRPNLAYPRRRRRDRLGFRLRVETELFQLN
jgi:hypothetical protein